MFSDRYLFIPVCRFDLSPPFSCDCWRYFVSDQRVYQMSCYWFWLSAAASDGFLIAGELELGIIDYYSNGMIANPVSLALVVQTDCCS